MEHWTRYNFDMSSSNSIKSPNSFRGEMPSLSTSLLFNARAMQPEAWARLVDVFSPIVYRWARRSGLAEADAADVVQDVFLAVAKGIGGFERQKDSGSFRSWLATITRNRIRDFFRKKARYETAEGGTRALQRLNQMSADAPQEPSDAELDQSVDLAELGHRIPARVLQILKADCEPKTWQAFWMTAVLGDSASDVAQRLNINVASVYQAKSRMLRRLRKRIDELPQ
jgi:RNA polymerase sigma-70 factor (ECF subfamily)